MLPCQTLSIDFKTLLFLTSITNITKHSIEIWTRKTNNTLNVMHGLEIQFWSVKCTIVTRILKDFVHLFSPIQAIQGDCYSVSMLTNYLKEFLKPDYTAYILIQIG